MKGKLCFNLSRVIFPHYLRSEKNVRWRLPIVVARSTKPPIFKTKKYRLAKASNRLLNKEVFHFIVLSATKPKEGKLC